MLTPEQVGMFDRDGYVLGGRILNDMEIKTLQDELDRVIQDHGKPDVPQPVLLTNMTENDQHPVWQILNIFEASNALRQLVHHPVIVEEMAPMTRVHQLRIWHDQIQYKPADTGGISHWHQDSPYWPILQPKHKQVSAWMAMDDVDESNGCMSMIRGSHLWGDQIEFLHEHLSNFHHPPTEFQGHPLHVELRPVPAGYVHYHHALTWHGSQANTSDPPRRVIALHYITERTRYDESGEHPMKPFISVADGQPLIGARFPIVWPAPETV